MGSDIDAKEVKEGPTDDDFDILKNILLFYFSLRRYCNQTSVKGREEIYKG